MLTAPNINERALKPFMDWLILCVRGDGAAGGIRSFGDGCCSDSDVVESKLMSFIAILQRTIRNRSQRDGFGSIHPQYFTVLASSSYDTQETDKYAMEEPSQQAVHKR